MNDQAQRDQALDISQSFIVQAPAGSGKTELLTQRYLKLLSTCSEPEKM
ncbi:ATP-dependent DNA helicase pcrA [uncultured Candidatus Thioglobus sp.]|nr:ATP-dependent DNA helicase pcrA [uncultured Candidatus Thioglobus sp.]